MPDVPDVIKQMRADAEEMLQEATRKAKVARDLIKAVDAYMAETEDE